MGITVSRGGRISIHYGEVPFISRREPEPSQTSNNRMTTKHVHIVNVPYWSYEMPVPMSKENDLLQLQSNGVPRHIALNMRYLLWVTPPLALIKKLKMLSCRNLCILSSILNRRRIIQISRNNSCRTQWTRLRENAATSATPFDSL
jgi:hypothetical protein